MIKLQPLFAMKFEADWRAFSMNSPSTASLERWPPSISGGDGVVLNFSSGISRVDFTADDAVFGVSTQVGGPQQPGRRSLGVAVPPNAPAMAPITNVASGAADLGLLNQILHALWMSGYFENEVDAVVSNVVVGLPGPKLT